MNRADSYCGAHDGPRWLRGGGRPILMYHKFGQPRPRSRLRALYVTPTLLRDQLRGLLRAGLRASSPAELREHEAAFSVTIDDACESALLRALPVLLELQVQATLYVVAGRLGGTNDWEVAVGEPRERLMDEAQVRAWLASGQRIGSHTLTHPRLTALDDAAVREELQASRLALEDRFQQPVTELCYPFGAHDERIRHLTREAGYTSAVTVEPGTVQATSDPLRLPRLLARHRWPGPAALFSRLVQLFSRRP